MTPSVADASPSTADRIVLVGGHESSGGRDLAMLAPLFDDAVAVAADRALAQAVGDALAVGRRAYVVPMTLGRDPVMVANSARSLRSLAGQQSGSVALTQPFADAGHLIGLLRHATRQAHRRDPGAALILCARGADPFDDAELHRVAHLVRVHGVSTEIAVAALADDQVISDTCRRLRLLGHERFVAIPADFSDGLTFDAAEPPVPGLTLNGSILSSRAVRRIVLQRVADAHARLDRGDDGIRAGLASDHARGYAHTHAHTDTHHHAHEDHAPAPPTSRRHRVAAMSPGASAHPRSAHAEQTT